MIDRKILLDQANELGLEFKSNIPGDKLQKMIDDEVNKNVPAVESVDTKPKKANNLRPRLTGRQRIAQAKKRALKTHVVTLTNKDNRENDQTTTAPLSFENAHFGIARDVPLDIPVEIEAALIEIAEGTMMTLHKAEIKDGRPTGNKIPVSVKKYAISYSKPE